MQKRRKPSFEKISPVIGSSFSVKQYLEPSPNINAPFWHFHPEIELVYVKGGSGSRHIGNHLSYYQGGDLVLIGSMLPHSGFTDRLSGNESEIVIHFALDFLGEGFFENIEMDDIRRLLLRAKAGIAFHGESKETIGAKIERLPTLFNFAKVIELLCILQDMAWAEDYTMLNADGYSFEAGDINEERVNKIYEHVRQEYARHIPLEEISKVANMTVPAFCRYFKKLSGKTFTQFVNDYRIVQACKLLVEQSLSIADVCFESGFNNFSHFSRLFKKSTGMSPSQYRNQRRQLIEQVAHRV